MNADQLRDCLSELMEWRFPDLPVRLAFAGRVYEIGRVRSSNRHIILEPGEEEELSKHWHEGRGESDEASTEPTETQPSPDFPSERRL